MDVPLASSGGNTFIRPKIDLIFQKCVNPPWTYLKLLFNRELNRINDFRDLNGQT